MMTKTQFSTALASSTRNNDKGPNLGKPQTIRLIDVFAIGSMMIYAAATVWYNGRNYLRRLE